MNTTKASAIELAKAVANGAPVGRARLAWRRRLFISMRSGKCWPDRRVALGAQDAYFEKSGAFTGEISVDMLKDVGVKFVLTGHSERRHVLKESPELVGKRPRRFMPAGLILVHCVGEKLEERDANQTLAVVEAQLKELKPCDHRRS